MPLFPTPSAPKPSRLVLTWLICAVPLGLLSVPEWLELRRLRFMLVHIFILLHPALSFTVLFLVFAGVYFLLDDVLRLPYRRRRAWIHFALTAAAAVMVVGPRPALAVLPGLSSGQIETLTNLGGQANTWGYVLALLSFWVFARLLIEAVAGGVSGRATRAV